MELLNSFLGQGMVAQIGEIVLFANTVTMAMPTRWRGNMVMDYLSRILNYLAMNIGKNKNNVVFARPTSTRVVAGKRLMKKIKTILISE